MRRILNFMRLLAQGYLHLLLLHFSFYIALSSLSTFLMIRSHPTSCNAAGANIRSYHLMALARLHSRHLQIRL